MIVGPPATETDIVGFYRKNAHEDENHGYYINAMRFCNLFRMITEERGNLYQEMLLFDRFIESTAYRYIYDSCFYHPDFQLLPRLV